MTSIWIGSWSTNSNQWGNSVGTIGFLSASSSMEYSVCQIVAGSPSSTFSTRNPSSVAVLSATTDDTTSCISRYSICADVCEICISAAAASWICGANSVASNPSACAQAMVRLLDAKHIARQQASHFPVLRFIGFPPFAFSFILIRADSAEMSVGHPSKIIKS